MPGIAEAFVDQVQLRAATPDDVEAIAAIWHGGWLEAHVGHVPESIRPFRRLAHFRERVPPRVPLTTVATLGMRLVGFVTVHDEELEQLYVAPDTRGGAVATPLIRHAEKRIAERGPVAWLAVVPRNTRARRFYERNEWRDAGGFDYPAEIEGGTLPVPCRRYEKRVRS